MSDLLVTGIGALVTPEPEGSPRLTVTGDAAVAVRGGVVTWVGPASAAPAWDGPTLDAGGGAVVPGFVDAHTHLVFAGDRSAEFTRRLRGERYEDILAGGGGIHATVAATRSAATEDLLATTVARAGRMLARGTTTVEIKSGYGLTTDEEMRLLEVARRAGELTPLDVHPTFLGAHVVPAGVDRADYVTQVVDAMPAVAAVARSCDVFCDRGAFTVDEARAILEAAAAAGLSLRVHAEQLARTGAALLAAELGAISADHLDKATPADAAALAAAGTVAVLLPGAAFSLQTPQAPARMLWDAGVAVALATDCNPGTSYLESMPLVVALACLQMGLTPDEALWAATRGGALALGEDGKGWVGPGAAGDLVVLDAPSHEHLPYRPGSDLVAAVVKAGAVVHGG